MTKLNKVNSEIVFDKISTGAQSDLDQVTKMAYGMIAVYGMNEKVGNISFYGLQKDQFQKPYSDETATLIDEEVRKLIDSQYIRAKELLTEYKKELVILAEALLEREVILKSDVEKLIGNRPFEIKVSENGTTTEDKEAEKEEETAE